VLRGRPPTRSPRKLASKPDPYKDYLLVRQSIGFWLVIAREGQIDAIVEEYHS
jgi:hypothetical protein